MLQRRAHGGDLLQPVIAQVELHQAGHVEGVGRDALVRQLVVCHPDILQLGQTGQEALWERVDGVVLHVELVQLVRQRVWHLRKIPEVCRGMGIFSSKGRSAN